MEDTEPTICAECGKPILENEGQMVYDGKLIHQLCFNPVPKLIPNPLLK